MGNGSSSDETAEGQQESTVDRRRFFRVEVPLKGRFLTPGGEEKSCLVSNISAGGALVRTKEPLQTGDAVILYIDDLGRFEGQVIRASEDAFAVNYKKRRARNQKTADNLTRVVNQARIKTDRRGMPRIRQDEPALVQFGNGQQIECSILDISLTGASIEISPRPELGTKLVLGKMAAKVVRRHDTGVGLVFMGPARRMDEVIDETAKTTRTKDETLKEDGAEFARPFGRKGASA